MACRAGHAFFHGPQFRRLSHKCAAIQLRHGWKEVGVVLTERDEQLLIPAQSPIGPTTSMVSTSLSDRLSISPQARSRDPLVTFGDSSSFQEEQISWSSPLASKSYPSDWLVDKT